MNPMTFLSSHGTVTCGAAAPWLPLGIGGILVRDVPLPYSSDCKRRPRRASSPLLIPLAPTCSCGVRVPLKVRPARNELQRIHGGLRGKPAYASAIREGGEIWEPRMSQKAPGSVPPGFQRPPPSDVPLLEGVVPCSFFF